MLLPLVNAATPLARVVLAYHNIGILIFTVFFGSEVAIILGKQCGQHLIINFMHVMMIKLMH